ncbi:MULTISPECIES: glycosyltransferase family 4 protein [unclassified Sporosarcina]|uniref:glycosyltransferase family 4 protein n=1 Tax=unclassified Sporosarcina TaxID=2647733 RepID=UPI00204117E4|nr:MULTISPECIES: glycosyltransferase family 4 protein [unclassified Sporosarcina]GKV66224.1 glycosyltransferase WbuB [Sporosarcina sp. NCCP-2331]GLB56260.1 glycosyltransferase WbuB [Sporosarcina sp. NCCP-2378]
MNIWILNHYAISPKSNGGTRHFDLARELIEKGHSVRIFASSFNHFEQKETVQYGKDVYREETINDVEYTWIKTPSYMSSLKRLINIGVFSIRLNHVINRYFKFERPDLIIGSSVHPLTPLVGIRKAKKAHALFYFEERDLWPQTFIDFGMISKKNIVSKLLFSIEKYLYRNSDKVIFLFERANEYAYKNGLPANKNIYLPNGFSVERVNAVKSSQEIDKLLAPYHEKKVCVYTGSMGEANHMIRLLELADLMQNNKEYHFLFVGNGPLKSSLVEYAEGKKMKNVSFHASIPKEQIPYLLNKAHCGLLSMKDSPLYKWGFSMNKIYDYLSVGLPVLIYTGLESLGELEKGKVVFYSNSVEGLRDMLLQESDVDRQYIQDFAHEHYSWEVLANKLLEEVYRNQAEVHKN